MTTNCKEFPRVCLQVGGEEVQPSERSVRCCRNLRNAWWGSGQSGAGGLSTAPNTHTAELVGSRLGTATQQQSRCPLLSAAQHQAMLLLLNILRSQRGLSLQATMLLFVHFAEINTFRPNAVTCYLEAPINDLSVKLRLPVCSLTGHEDNLLSV